jgi:hypothetical protein
LLENQQQQSDASGDNQPPQMRHRHNSDGDPATAVKSTPPNLFQFIPNGNSSRKRICIIVIYLNNSLLQL